MNESTDLLGYLENHHIEAQLHLPLFLVLLCKFHLHNTGRQIPFDETFKLRQTQFRYLGAQINLRIHSFDMHGDSFQQLSDF